MTMKKLVYTTPAIKAADMESEAILVTSFDINNGTTDEQWGKENVDDFASGSIWD